MKKKITAVIIAGIGCIALVFANYAINKNGNFCTINGNTKSFANPSGALVKMKIEKNLLENNLINNSKVFSDREERLKELTEDIAKTEMELGIYDYEEDIRMSFNAIEAAASDNLRIAQESDEETAERIKKHSQELFDLVEKYETILEKKEYESGAELMLQYDKELREINEKYMKKGG